MDNNEPRTLKTVFQEAESLRLSLETTPFPPNSPDYHSTVSRAVSLYRETASLISLAALFSPNETLDDLSTTDLPFLLVSYHLAELLQKLPSSSLSERKSLLSSARESYERFLHLLDSYDLLSPQYKKLLENYTDAPTTFSVASSSDPATKRNAKIASFKAEKELKQKLEFLRRRPEYGTEDDETTGAGGGDEHAVREVHLTNLSLSVHLTFNALDSLNREWEILSMAPPEPTPPQSSQQAQDDARRRNPTLDVTYSDRLDERITSRAGRGGPILSTQGKPLQPFTLLANRQEMARGVFRPSHNLPTMTIDEYLEEERRRGGIIEGGGEASGVRPEPDEDDYDKADAETLKARAWDEFVEANPKGSGNTLNRG